MPTGEPPAGRRQGTRGGRAPRRGSAGYSLVVLIMALSVLSIMLAAALPMWSERIKRDKEEELISRGWQYVEAIRVFQKRFQRFPVSFDELLKAKPRCIRQLWKDPMTDDGPFVPIFLGQGSQIQVPGMPDAQGQNSGLSSNSSLTFSSEQPPTVPGAPGQTGQQAAGSGSDANQPVAVGPIVGVRSRSTAKSLLLFYGHDHYNLWEFRLEMLTRGAGNTQVAGSVAGIGVTSGRGGGLALSTRWLGRPMPGFPTPGSTLMPGSLPGSSSGFGSSGFGNSGFGNSGFGSGSGATPAPSPTPQPGTGGPVS